MCLRRAIWLVPILLLGVARAAESDPDLVHAEKTLQEATIATDGPALLRFFRERTLTEAERARLADAVHRLGDEDFETREKASEELSRAGRRALPVLKAALNDKDRERARRAEQCVQSIESGRDLMLVAAAARVLAEKKADDAVAALLGYLPGADDEPTEDAILRALVILGSKDGKPDAELVKALTAKEPLRRVAAAHVLGRGVPGQREAVRRLFSDPEPRVRFEAATGLMRGGDKEAVTVLIGLLAEGPMPLGWRAQELLFRVAGEKAPTLSLTDEEMAKRAKVADAWRVWWKDAAATTDLAKINLDDALQGINVVCEIPPNEQMGRVWAFRADGKLLWEFKDVPGPVDVQVLPNGRILVGEWHTTQVTERDRTGKIFWTKKVTSSITTCKRLPNGNTFIGTYTEMIEVDPKGTVLYTRKDPDGGSIYRAHRLPNGHLLYASSAGKVVELDAEGKVFKSVKIPVGGGDWTSLDPLPGGRYLVAIRSSGKVIEMDSEGKLLWECNAPSVMSAVRLPNGNTLVASYDTNCMVFEYNQAKQEVWKMKVDARPFCIRRY